MSDESNKIYANDNDGFGSNVSTKPDQAELEDDTEKSKANHDKSAVASLDNVKQEQERSKKKAQIKESIASWVVALLIAIICVALLRLFIVTPYEIPSSSMETTIMTGDFVLSEKVSYYTSAPKQGDIITFHSPVEDNTLIKRVIAVGGQTVDLRDGSVYVDGEKLDEPYTNGKVSEPLPTQADGKIVSYPYKVPDGEVWVMGDNRTNSKDSRYFGSVPIENITGKAFWVYLPFNEIRALS